LLARVATCCSTMLASLLSWLNQKPPSEDEWNVLSPDEQVFMVRSAAPAWAVANLDNDGKGEPVSTLAERVAEMQLLVDAVRIPYEQLVRTHTTELLPQFLLLELARAANTSLLRDILIPRPQPEQKQKTTAESASAAASTAGSSSAVAPRAPSSSGGVSHSLRFAAALSSVENRDCDHSGAAWSGECLACVAGRLLTAANAQPWLPAELLSAEKGGKLSLEYIVLARTLGQHVGAAAAERILQFL